MAGFNRTFMELKFFTIVFQYKTISSFNRTFMELKYEILDSIIKTGRQF